MYSVIRLRSRVHINNEKGRLSRLKRSSTVRQIVRGVVRSKGIRTHTIARLRHLSVGLITNPSSVFTSADASYFRFKTHPLILAMGEFF